MWKMTRLIAVTLMLSALGGCSGCSSGSSGLRDGYYTAEAADFDHLGWKEYLTIYVNNNTIVTAEYNAKNASGFLRSWDMDYMRRMNKATGTYPNKFSRAYTSALLNRQNPNQINAIYGAEQSHKIFQLLAEAAIDRARAGDKKVAFVSLPETAAP